MDDEVGSWMMAFFHGRISFKSIYKALGPSLGVKQMWTKRNDHAPKSECVDWKKIKIKIYIYTHTRPRWAFLRIN